MDTSLYVYVIVLAVGFILFLLSLINYALAFSLFIAIYPIIYTVPVPGGWEAYPASRLIISLFFLISLIKIKQHWHNISFKGIIYSYLVFLAMLIISAMVSQLPWEGFTRSLIYLVPLMFFSCGLVTVIDDKKGLKYMFIGILFGFTLTSLYGILEFLLQNNVLVGLGIITQDYDWITDIRLGYGRITSFIGQPVYASLYFMYTIPIIYFIMKYYIIDSIVNQIITFITLISIICIIYTGSRTGLVGLGLLIVIYYLLGSHERKILKIIPVTLMILLTFYFFAPEGFLTATLAAFKINYPIGEESSSFLGRIDVTGAMWEIAKENILFGLGPGFIFRMQAARGLFEELYGMENQYAALLADAGIFGFASFIIFLTITIRANGRMKLSEYPFVRDWGNVVNAILWVLIITSFAYGYIGWIIFDLIMLYLGIEVGLSYIESQEQYI